MNAKEAKAALERAEKATNRDIAITLDVQGLIAADLPDAVKTLEEAVGIIEKYANKPAIVRDFLERYNDGK